MTRAPLIVNGETWTEGPRHVPPPPEPRKPKPRVFDHLGTAPIEEDRHFSRVARWMRSSAWWHSVPKYEEPAPMAGEVSP